MGVNIYDIKAKCYRNRNIFLEVGFGLIRPWILVLFYNIYVRICVLVLNYAIKLVFRVFIRFKKTG